MHIPGKPLMRSKNSMFRNTDSRRLAYASQIRASVIYINDPDHRLRATMLAQRIESGVGHTTTKNTSNQRKKRLARRQRWAAGDRFAFSLN
jgi:hypothetical protein